MTYYEALSGFLFVCLFCMAVPVRIYYVEKEKPLWDKLLTWFLTLIFIFFFGGLGVASGYNALVEMEHQTPKIVTTPALPDHWWRCNDPR